ncbi:hypothetical protein ASC80_14980 [Afipia sp. Root123D2]|uniref:hypothetical protein n=1 Tax=Afipia sp. Root123D2 TaxID=1736436 RepID=UPI0006F4963B|nr:hypothetical protein [Afipia sp. Root123D2]KQW21383.1 hypothetical protein ASC80_14980 [Afipia sp. Root123D2]
MTEQEEGNVTQPSAQKKQLQSLVINGACLVLVVVGLTLVSNKLLDKFDRANEPGPTTDQRKEKAQRNQQEWDNRGYQRQSSARDTSKMCPDAAVIETAKRLINEQIPNVGQFGEMLRRLDASRDGAPRDLLGEKEKFLRETKEYYAQNPVDPNDHTMGDQNAARAERIAKLEKEVAQLRVKSERIRKSSEQMQNATNEIIVTGEPIPTDFDPNLNRVACQLTFKVKGLG